MQIPFSLGPAFEIRIIVFETRIECLSSSSLELALPVIYDNCRNFRITPGVILSWEPKYKAKSGQKFGYMYPLQSQHLPHNPADLRDCARVKNTLCGVVGMLLQKGTLRVGTYQYEMPLNVVPTSKASTNLRVRPL
jgi:hypothetical protein